MTPFYDTGPAFDTVAAGHSIATASESARHSIVVHFGILRSDASVFDAPYLYRTGGDATLLLAEVCNRSGSVTPLALTQANPSALSPLRRNTSELLGIIQSAFGLSITAMAAALRVERPTIYAWLKGTSSPTPANAARLATVAELSERWLRCAAGQQYPDPGRELVQGKSLQELLRDEHLRTYVIGQALSRAAKAHIEMAPAEPVTIRELARQRGIKPGPSDDLDLLTERRLGPED